MFGAIARKHNKQKFRVNKGFRLSNNYKNRYAVCEIVSELVKDKQNIRKKNCFNDHVIYNLL